MEILPDTSIKGGRLPGYRTKKRNKSNMYKKNNQSGILNKRENPKHNHPKPYIAPYLLRRTRSSLGQCIHHSRVELGRLLPIESDVYSQEIRQDTHQFTVTIRIQEREILEFRSLVVSRGGHWNGEFEMQCCQRLVIIQVKKTVANSHPLTPV